MNQARTLGLSGIVVESLIKLLAYNRVLLSAELEAKILNSSFHTSTNLHSRIAHAASLLYSVPRGHNAVATFRKVVANTSDEVIRYLDPAFQFGGIYYYYNVDAPYSTVVGEPKDISFVLCDKPIRSETVNVSSQGYQYIDFNVSDVSESFRISDDSGRVVRVTDKPYEFFSNERLPSGEYEFKFLVITTPNYGIRLIKRVDDSWGSSSFTLDYLVYSEVDTDLSFINSLGNFSLVKSGEDRSIESLEKPKSRVEDLEQITSLATKGFMCRDQINSISDLEFLIESTRDTEDLLTIYNIVPNNNGYIIYVLSGLSAREELRRKIDVREPSFSVSVEGMKARPVTIEYTVDTYSKDPLDIMNYYKSEWRRSRSLTLQKVNTDIIRFDPAIGSCDSKLTKSNLDSLDPGEYFEIRLVRKGA